ncbi:PEP-CTERM sorting domain-containing protein [Thalassotalea piscium]
MSSKIFNVILFCFTSFFVTANANAGLIVGDYYADELGVQWEYVGSFDLADGEYYKNATPVNGLEAAVLNFGLLSPSEQYALSSNKVTDFINIDDYIVNHKALYDAFDWMVGIHEASESAVANNAGGATYDAIDDISAFVRDRAASGENINHVFKGVNVPEPATLALFLLVLIPLTARRFNK